MIQTILAVVLALLTIGIVSGVTIWFVVWAFKKVFHLED